MRIASSKLICVVALALMLGLSARTFAQQHAARLLVRQTAAQSLTLIQPTDRNFDSTLDAYFPGLSEEENYPQAIRPFLVIVRNDNGSTAVAYSITWTVHYAGGSVRPLRALFVNRPLMDQGAVTYLTPGEVRLISPMFNLTPEEYGHYESIAPLYPGSRKLTSVDADVDGVVYGDGTFIGPDTTKVLQRYAMAQFATRDEILAALNLVNSSAAPPLVVAGRLAKMFNRDFQWDQLAYQHTLLAMYVRARGNTAMDLRRILLARGTVGLEKLLQDFVERSRAGTNASSFNTVYEKLSDSDPRVFGITPWGPKER